MRVIFHMRVITLIWYSWKQKTGPSEPQGADVTSLSVPARASVESRHARHSDGKRDQVAKWKWERTYFSRGNVVY